MANDALRGAMRSIANARAGMAIAYAVVAGATGPAAAAAVPADAGHHMLVEIAGVYRERLGVLEENDRYVAESIMEIVPVGSGYAYVRLRTMWANHHQCSMYGIFRVEGNALVHRSRTRTGETCRFIVERRTDRFVIRDPTGQCDISCGARGAFDGDDRFRLARKMRIRYLPRILASDEYRAAIAAHENRIPRADTMLLQDMDRR